MHSRNGPDLDCAGCGAVIGGLVVIVTRYDIEPRQAFGLSWEAAVHCGRITVCGACWDAAPPDPDPDAPGGNWASWRRHGSQRWVIGKQPGTWPCAWCHRDVLAGTARRRFPSCSKRCQVYYSQERHGTVRSRRRDRDRGTRWEVPAERQCDGCGTAFAPRQLSHRYCSGACRQAAYRQRKAPRRAA